ncbi:uncharacterized protein K441DRAFT_652749 [Cenococcum geophilum 1.58]|uniref:uncharacterized protein n=1 Tax=Cenococcum geophilum 1.58 TaxID=794803 RepID=UPI00358FEB0A|nr:hypothetical protein K441DRAFT_652749 [Cenococcum geophilum 1.58]
MSFGVGEGLAVLSLITSLKGAWDTYLWIEYLVKEDKDAQWLLLKYEYETSKLDRWKARLEEVQKKGREPFDAMPQKEQKLVWGYLAQVNMLKLDMVKKFNEHGLLSLPDYSVPAGEDQFDKTPLPRDFQPEKKTKFKAKTKQVLEESVAKYKEAINDLNELLQKYIPVETMAVALPQVLLSRSRPNSDLSLLARQAMTIGPLLANCAAIKALDTGVSSLAVPEIPRNGLGMDQHGPQTVRTMGWYQSERIFVEWKFIRPNLTATDRDKVLSRVQKLGTLLYQPKQPEFHIPSCLGITTGPNSARGYVYKLPSETSKQLGWYTLEDWLTPKFDNQGNKLPKTTPLLGDRFRLAQALVGVFSLLHACNWLHKDFQSSDVLFFDRDSLEAESERISIKDMYVTGFQYSRPDGDLSIESPGISPYRHPDAFKGFRKQFDWYSLGVVLIEIALWESLPAQIPKGLKPEEIRDGMLQSLKSLGGKVGEAYRDVVKVCLEGNTGNAINKVDEELAMDFLVKVVDPLAACAA